MKKINPKYLIAAAIVVVVLVIAIIAFAGKGKDKPIKDDDKTGTKVEETLEGTETDKTDSSESDEPVEVIVQDIDPETGKPIEIETISKENLSIEEINAAHAEINKKNQEKIDALKKKIEQEGESVLDNVSDDIKNILNTEEDVINIGNAETSMDMDGVKADFSDLSMMVDLNQNHPMTREEMDAGFKYWWIYNFIPDDSDRAIVKVYTELHELKDKDAIVNDIFVDYPNFTGVSVTYRRVITDEKVTSTEYENYTTYKYEYTTDDGCNISNLYIVPNYDLLNEGDQYRVYSISINNTDNLELPVIKNSLVTAINKMLGVSDFTFEM